MPKHPGSTGTPSTGKPSLPPHRAIEILEKLIEESAALESEPFGSPRRDEWTATAEGALERAFSPGSSIVTTFGAAQAVAISTHDNEETLRRTANRTLSAEVFALRSAIKQLSWSVAQGAEDPNAETADAPGRLMIFISHSSKDAVLAEALVNLFRAALAVPADLIRCSSVDGYRLPVGINTEQKLREEVKTAKVVVGLITPNSLGSHFVMFELGARWGSGYFLAPLLAGLSASELSGPLSLLNALSAIQEGQLHQLVADISKQIGCNVQNTASFLRNVTEVKNLAGSIQEGSPAARPPKPNPFSISFDIAGKPPSQFVAAKATERVRVTRIEYLLSSEACIASKDLDLDGYTIEAPIDHDSLTKLLNTPRSDMIPYDLSGPVKIALTVQHAGAIRQYIIPAHMSNVIYGNTYYRTLTGSKAFN